MPARSKADKAVVAEAERVLAIIQKRMKKQKTTAYEILKNDMYLCGMLTSILYLYDDLPHLVWPAKYVEIINALDAQMPNGK